MDDLATHLSLWSLRSTLSLLLDASTRIAPLEELLARHPGLVRHIDAAAQAGYDGLSLTEALARLDARLLDSPDTTLPLNRLRSALQLNAATLSAFVLCGWLEDAPELAPLAEDLGGHDGRCTRAQLSAGVDLASLLDAGLLQETRQGRRRTLEMPAPISAALRGQVSPPWRLTPLGALAPLQQLILPAALREAAARPGHEVCWALRGSPGSGRRTLAGAIARAHGLALLEAPPADDTAPGEAELHPALAMLLGAMPLLSPEPAPGQRLALPDWPHWPGPLAARLPRHGGLESGRRPLRWLDLTPPDAEERAAHWRAALGRTDIDTDLAAPRLPRGRIHRLAAQLSKPTPAALTAEIEAAGRYMLDGAARRMPAPLDGETLSLGEELQQEFDALVARCRHRERLRAALPAAFGHGGDGVRALFKGPSGTGKTLAARYLAAALERPLYRVDLAATVSKYIGETERNLERVFEAAEALDIVLLLDEGDALMAGRTGVSNANDRYANLETNYLLQRLESFDGVLVVTTNAAERIDTAFARRMDLTLDFALPDAQQRQALWRAHLPHGHRVGEAALDEVARRCALSGGQIRNAALHAALLALQQAGPQATVGTTELLSALRREYRRAGLQCPSLALH